MQPPPSTQPADPQVAAIQAITDQLARMQQEARNYQASAARDREADRQEMLRRTAATQPAPGPSHLDVSSMSPTHPPPSASQESRRATAGQPAPGTSQEDPALSRYRQLLAACGAPATQPAPPRPKDVPPRLPLTPETALLQLQPTDLQAQTSCRMGMKRSVTSPPHSSPFRPTP